MQLKILFHIQENILVDYNMSPPDFAVFILGLHLPLIKKQVGQGIVDYKAVVSERVYYQASKEQTDILHPVVIFDHELRKCFDDDFISHKEMLEYFDRGNFSDKIKTLFARLHKEKLTDFEPDIIISIGLYNELYNHTFPNAPHIAWQWGTLKRDTSPTTHAFDPVGYIKDSCFNHFKDEINNLKLSDHQNKIINDFKTNYKALIRKKRPEKLAKIITEYKAKFDYLVLLPLSVDRNNYFALESDFKHQWDLVTYVLDSVPSNVGVIVTEHTAQYFIDLNDAGYASGHLKWFQNKYKNFIYIKELKHYHATSFWVLPEVDGIISVGTTVPLTATLFDTKIISLSKSCQDEYKDAQGLDDILGVLKFPTKDKNSFIYWTLTHYNFFEKQLGNENFMFEQFNKWVNKYKIKGITFDWFEKINDEKEICDFILKNTEESLANLQEKPLSGQELIAYERSRYKQHYEDMLRQRDECANFKTTTINILGLKIKIGKKKSKKP